MKKYTSGKRKEEMAKSIKKTKEESREGRTGGQGHCPRMGHQMGGR